MKLAKIEEMSTEELVKRFAAICASQDDALLRSQIAKFKLLYNEMAAVEDELKSRPGDQRRALLRLYNHPNCQVRLQSAGATLAVATDTARQLIETIASSRKYPQAATPACC
ncbi:MAG: DUF2019 domain-containing protein [Pseudolabrys sp.]|jgi:hypothetical protein